MVATPEIDAQKDQPAAAKAAMDQYGCFVLRNAFPTDQMDFLSEKTKEFFKIARDGGAEALAPLVKRTPEQIKGHAEGAQLRGVIHSAIMSLFVYGDPNKLETSMAKMLADNRVLKFIEPILGPSVLHTANMALRVRDPQNPDFALPFHQDGVAYDRSLLDASPNPIMMVIWLPFTGCDDDTPGLEVVPKRIRDTYSLTTAPKTKFKYLEADVPDDLEVWYPHLNKGDCIIFADMTLHRCYPGQAKHARTSVDLRVFSKGMYPTALLGHQGLELPGLNRVEFKRPETVQ